MKRSVNGRDIGRYFLYFFFTHLVLRETLLLCGLRAREQLRAAHGQRCKPLLHGHTDCTRSSLDIQYANANVSIKKI